MVLVKKRSLKAESKSVSRRLGAPAHWIHRSTNARATSSDLVIQGYHNLVRGGQVNDVQTWLVLGINCVDPEDVCSNGFVEVEVDYW